MTKKQILLENHRVEVLRAAQRHGVRKIMLCGSVARGDAQPDSDYDFLVEMGPGRSLMDLGGLQMDLQEILGEDVDILTKGSLHGAVKRSIYAEAKEI